MRDSPRTSTRNSWSTGRRRPYTISLDVWYRLRVWKGPLDADGQWWSAFIENENTGADTWIGSIKVAPTHQAMTTIQDFSEYFGGQVACTKVPQSIVDFTQPAANLGSGGASAAVPSAR